MNQDIVGKKVVVLVRGNPDDHNPDPTVRGSGQYCS